jgi:threonine/homoserine/homoserine lactone efflux protein
MSDIGVLLAILSALLIGAISPGPSFVLVAKVAISNSRMNGLATALGMGAGGLLFAALALGGLVSLLQQVEWLFSVLKLMGGLFLVYIAVSIWRQASTPMIAPAFEGAERKSLLRSFSVGFITQVSNPKTVLVYTSIFAALLPASPPMWMLVVTPPLIFAIEAGWYSIVAFGFSTRGPRASYLAAKPWIDRFTAAVMGALGLRLIMDSPD